MSATVDETEATPTKIDALLVREFSATVSAPRPIDFGADKERAVLTALRAKYEGRCWKGVYIREIVEVARMGDVRIGRDSAATGTVDVWFRARIAVYPQWSILPTVKIAVTAPMVCGEYFESDERSKTDVKLADVIVQATAALVAVPADAVVPVRVIHTPYYRPLGIPIIATVLLTCELAAPVYYTRGVVDAADLPMLRALLDAVRGELARRPALSPGAVWFFESLFYSYDGTPPYNAATAPAPVAATAWWGPPEASVAVAPFTSQVDLLAAAAAATGEGPAADDDGASVAGSVAAGRRALAGYWTRPPHIYRSSPAATRFATNTDGVTATEMSGAALLTALLSNQLEWLRCIRALAQRFPDNASIAAQRTVWAALRAAQLPRPT